MNYIYKKKKYNIFDKTFGFIEITQKQKTSFANFILFVGKSIL